MDESMSLVVVVVSVSCVVQSVIAVLLALILSDVRKMRVAKREDQPNA